MRVGEGKNARGSKLLCNCPERKISLDFRSVLFRERQEKLSLPFHTGSAAQSPVRFACWPWLVNAWVRYLKPWTPLVEATNTSYYVKITFVIFSFIKTWRFSGDTGAQNITPVIETKPAHPLNYFLILPAVTPNHERTFVPTSFSYS